MKRNSIASLSFKREIPSQKTAFGANVVNKLTTSAAVKGVASPYPNLPVSVADLLDVNNRLFDANSAAKSGAYVDVAALENVVTEWNDKYTLTAAYVSSIAASNLELIRFAGFVPTKSEAQKQPAAGGATGFTAHTNGKKGAIIARSKTKVPLAKGYVFTAVPDGVDVTYEGNVMVLAVGEKTIYITAHTKKNVEIFNLPSGIPYNVSMFGFNSTGSGAAAASQQVIPQ